MKTVWVVAAGLIALAAFVYLNNASGLAPAMRGRPVVLAHRGLAQTFPSEGLTNETCTAKRIYPPTHALLENTLASMQAAFDAGADVVEIDVHPTSDGHFAVFHDWTLDCRTDGTGVTREHTLAQLKALDIGYGYTADGGKTYPFRGKGVGLMPSLAEVLAAFPGKRFLINTKGNDASEGSMLGEHLAQLGPTERRLLMAYGGDRPMTALHARLPKLKVLSKSMLKTCGLAYLGIGWTGYVPPSCRNMLLVVPANYAGLLWGWPGRFLARMRGAGTEVFVAGAYARGDAGSSGIDSAEDYRALPQPFDGGIWTNRIDVIGPLARAKTP